MNGYDAGTALLVADVQNDFADPGGSLYVAGGEAVVASVNAEIVRALAGGAHVLYSQDWHPPSTPHFATEGGIWPVHCVAGTAGAQLHPRLLLAGPVVRKGVGGEDGYSAFTMQHPTTGKTSPTGLAGLLGEAGAERIVVVGLALDYCVKATALDGRQAGFATTVLRPATAAVDLRPGDGDRAVDELRAAGVTVL